MSMQLYDALDAATEAALRASIARFGVLVPVTVDQGGQILDGHHRSRIAASLSVDCPVVVREVADEEEAREIARTLNEDRRMLARDQRLPVVIALREEGHSQPAIARALGVTQKTVWNDIQRAKDEVTTGRNLPAETIGLDGKTYPSSQPRPITVTRADDTRKRQGFRDRSKPFAITNERDEQRARAQTQKMAYGLSEINGICRGLKDVDYRVAAAHPDTDMTVWIKKVDDVIRDLRAIKNTMEEARADEPQA